MRKYTLKPAALYAIDAVIFIIAALLSALSWYYLTSIKILMYVLIALFSGLAVIFGIFLLPIYFRRTVIYLSAEDITVHSGVIFYRREQMKISAAQYLTRFTMPFGSVFGFNFLVIHGLGGSLVLPFLREKDCREIEAAIGTGGD